MSASPVRFHPLPVLYNNFFTLKHQLWVNLDSVPNHWGGTRTTMPERAVNAMTCGPMNHNAFVCNSGGVNHYWKGPGSAVSENPTPQSFGAVSLPYEYNLFSITNPETVDYFKSQLIPASAAVDGTDASVDMYPEMPEEAALLKHCYQVRTYPVTKHLQTRDVGNKARFSSTGLSAKYAVGDTKMSSAPPSPVAGSSGIGLGSEYPFVHPHVIMPSAFSIPQHKGSFSSSSGCSTADFKISSSSMSSYSSRSSMSSTPSSSGISPRKRPAEDSNYSNRHLYCRKYRQKNSENLMMDLRCSCEACITEEVTDKVIDVEISERFEEQRSKRSKNDDDVIYVSSESGYGRSIKSRPRRKEKRATKKNNYRKSVPRSPQENTTTFSFVAPQPLQDVSVADKIEVPGRYNLRSAAKKREDRTSTTTENESRSFNVHKVQSIVPSTVANACEIDKTSGNTSATTGKQTPRYQTRSRQKKVGVESQQHNGHQKKISPDDEITGGKDDSTSKYGHKEYREASVIRRVSSEAIRELLSTPQSPASPQKEMKKKEIAKERTTSLFKKLYEVHNVIGVGGGGTVHAGIRKSDGLQVAIKQVPKAKVKRWGKLNGYSVPIEFQLLDTSSRSGHQGVIRMLDWFERTNAFILVMERPQPVIDLFDYLNQSGALPEATARNIFRQIARATLHCHANGVVHRDIKDENVLLNLHTSEAKLIDFGCGTILKAEPYTEFAGTPEFYPPEWFINRRYYGQRVDAWSLGVLLYTMVEAEVPFQKEKDIVECKLHHKHGEQLSQSCKSLIQWMLQKEQRLRPSIAQVLKHEWFQGPDSPICNISTHKTINNSQSEQSLKNGIEGTITSIPKQRISCNGR